MRSEYVPVFEILWSVIVPDIASPEDAVWAVVALVTRLPGADGIVGLLFKSL